MTALSVEVERRELRLREPYTIAYETYDRVTLLFVRIGAGDALVGRGCASPAPEITGESADDCAGALTEAADRLREDGWPPAPATRSWMDALADEKPAAAAALDTALWELRAVRAGVPLHELLGGRIGPVPTSITLGIDGLAATVRRARERVAQGFRSLKIKGGRDPLGDAERLRGIRAAVGDGIELRFDANQGFDVAAARRFLEDTARIGLTLLEQPLAAADLHGAVELTEYMGERRSRGAETPLLLADESCVGLGDVASLAVRGAAEALNLKLMKVGGLRAASAADAVARAHRMPCMLSCMDESALSIAAALHWASAHPNVRWIDLDGHLDVLEDPHADLVELVDGFLCPISGPGLGSAAGH